MKEFKVSVGVHGPTWWTGKLLHTQMLDRARYESPRPVLQSQPPSAAFLGMKPPKDTSISLLTISTF